MDFPLEKGKTNLSNFHETESHGDYFSWGKGKTLEANLDDLRVSSGFVFSKTNLNLTGRDGRELVKSVLKERKEPPFDFQRLIETNGMFDQIGDPFVNSF